MGSHSLRPHGLQQTRFPCPSPTARVYSNLCPLSQWGHPIISSSAIPFSSHLQSFSPSRSFPMSQFIASGGQSIGVSAPASVLPMSIQDWFPLGLTIWSLCCPRKSQESSPIPQFKSINSFVLSFLYSSTLTSIHDYWKNHSFDQTDLYWLYLLFSMLSRLVIAFLPRSKRLFNFMAAVTICSDFGAQDNKFCHCFHCFPIFCHEVMGPDSMIFVFWMLTSKPAFPLSTFTFIKRLFSSSLSAIRVVSSAYLRFLPAILTPACASSSPAFPMMYSAYKLNKQGDNVQAWRTPFPTWNQSVVPCPVLTAASWPAYRFLKRQVRWPGIPVSSRIFHSCCDPHSQRLWHSQ